MKHLIILAVLSFGFLNAQAQEIKFFKGTFQEALVKAEKENKLIFVDAYTTWCGPCKYMSKNVFTDKDVAKHYNANFINVKLDQEKGEGLDFAKKYEVKFYPSLFFIQADGQVAHKIVGSMDAAEFIAFGKDAETEDKQLLYLQNEYKSGDMGSEHLMNLAYAMKYAYMDGTEKIVLEYLEKQSKWNTEENVQFVLDNFPTNVNGELFQFVLEERELFNKIEGNANIVEQKISGAIAKHLSNIEDGATENEIDMLYQEFYPETWQQKAESYKLSNLERSKNDPNKSEFIARKVSYLENYGSESWQELNAFAWTIYENSDDQDHLRYGQSYALQSIQLEENFYNTDTYIWISDKLNDKAAIKEYGPIAIKLGLKDGADVSALETLVAAQD